MVCVKKHGVLALTFHASFDSGIVCSKCFQFMKPGLFALNCEKCDKQDASAKEEIKKWKDSDRKWANLKRCNGDIFVDKTSIWVTMRDAYLAYVVHPHFYLGKTSSMLCLTVMCITDGCTKVCTLNAHYKHFKEEHMPGTHTIHPLRVIEVPTINTVEDESKGTEESDDLGDLKNVESTKMTKGNEGESNNNDGRENITLEVLARDMNKGRKPGELEDNGAKVGGKEDAKGMGNCMESMELDCKPYVDEGGPSDDDTESKEAIAKQKSVTKKKKGTNNTETEEAIAKQKSVTKKKKRTNDTETEEAIAKQKSVTKKKKRLSLIHI